MQITIYRGTHEIGGSLIELMSNKRRILLDAGYPLFLQGMPIEQGLEKMPPDRLLDLGVLPAIEGLYFWDEPAFDAIIISHAHIDHYGLIPFINSQIPIYMSLGTKTIIELSQRFKICERYEINSKIFKMYEEFSVAGFSIKPYLMDHSAFDAAAFEISANGKNVIYSGDFRGHGRKSVCLDTFIKNASKGADLLLIEGTMLGRLNETVMREEQLEKQIILEAQQGCGPMLFQSSSQNIDRLVSFYKATVTLGKIFIIDVYTANVLSDLQSLGNNLPHPSADYPNIRVFFPYYLTQKVFNEIGPEYAKRFSKYHISKDNVHKEQGNIIMQVRPSMIKDIEKCDFRDGIFIYSMWQGYRSSPFQERFEKMLRGRNFADKMIHTSGHASIFDLTKLIEGLMSKEIAPMHTMVPDEFTKLFHNVVIKNDGESFDI